jgi:DNA-binding NarL/FixJ family response regulator
VGGNGLGERDTCRLALTRAEALIALGRIAEAEAVLDAVLDATRSQNIHPQLWRARLALGSLRRAQGRDEEARLAFSDARTVIESLASMLPDERLQRQYREQATALFPRAYRLTERRALAVQHGGLTERERDVAVLVADGQTNREIAGTLVLSKRTVDTHVANILTKLGMTSRRDIIAWVAEHGIAGSHA